MWTVKDHGWIWEFHNGRTDCTFYRYTKDGWTPATVLSFVKSINMR